MSGTAGPKRLTRSRSDRLLGGVCGGVAAYLGADPTVVRLITVVAALFFGASILAYLVAWIVMPEEPEVPRGPMAGPGPTR
jgi:phage shock protein C